MTSRKEIERLLNQTGRTLEGLPDDYGDEKLKAWRSFRDGKFGHVKSFEMANRILHQSDVIELLVGALRDALDKPMQRPLTYDETLVAEDPVWVESEIPGVMDDWFYVYGGDDEEAELLGFGDEENWIKVKAMYNRTWRAWASRPTDEEKEAAAWEN